MSFRPGVRAVAAIAAAVAVVLGGLAATGGAAAPDLGPSWAGTWDNAWMYPGDVQYIQMVGTQSGKAVQLDVKPAFAAAHGITAHYAGTLSGSAQLGYQLAGTFTIAYAGQRYSGTFEVMLKMDGHVFEGFTHVKQAVPGPLDPNLSPNQQLRGYRVTVPPPAVVAPKTAKARPMTWVVPDRLGLLDSRKLVQYALAAPVQRAWPVHLTLPGCDQSALGSYAWTVGGAAWTAPKVLVGKACTVELTATLGKHKVAAQAPADGPAYSADVLLRDFLIVGIGDSVASGEGNPDIGKPAGGPVWQDVRCDRSAASFQAQAAIALEQHDRRTSVSFLHLACSGATVDEGLVGPYEGINPSGGALPPQISAIPGIVGTREVDAVLVSIGANDLGFTPVLTFCVKVPRCASALWPYEQGKSLGQYVVGRIAALPALYAAVDVALRTAYIKPSRVYINLYPDEFHDAQGRICDTILEGKVSGIRADEATWMFERFMTPLNQAIRTAAAKHGWHVIEGGPEAFRRHGYCAGSAGWVVKYEQSLAYQGNINGTMHPNRAGHRQLGALATRLLLRDLLPGGTPRPEIS